VRLLDQVVERAVRLSPARIGVALLYHRVGPVGGDPARELVPALRLDVFEAQLRLLRERFRLVRASELREAVAERRAGTPIPVAITFDDDSPSYTEFAAPLLLRLGLPATFFLNGASLDEPFGFWWERLQRAWDADLPGLAELVGVAAEPRPTIHDLGRTIESKQPHDRDALSERLLELAGPDPPDSGLRAEQVAVLSREGFEIGFHTQRHDRLPDLTDPELAEALAFGRTGLANVAGQEVSTIAYPHGRADDRVADSARAAGFDSGFTDLPRVIAPRSDPLLLGRLLPSFRSVSDFGSQLAKVLVRGLKPAARP
jgi:peptidoglycan/xylan/chitin deacetylase (PgdA/CDA1 family)